MLSTCFFGGPAVPGASRVFEMQLMPSLLLQLRVNDLADRERSEPDKTPGSDTKKLFATREADGNKNDAKASVLSPAGLTENPTAWPIEGDASTGVAEAQGGGRNGMPKGEEGDGDAEPVVPIPTAEERERLTTWGMDWGVVAVWSCPRSCESSHEECVVVQLPV